MANRGSTNPGFSDFNDDVNTVKGQVPADHAAVFRLVKSVGAQPGQTLTIEHRELPPAPHDAPRKVEARRRDHHFYKLQSFIQYLRRYGTAGQVTVFVDPERQMTHACLNEMSSHEVEVVSYAPNPRRVWKIFAESLDRNLRVREALQVFRALLPRATDATKANLEPVLEALAFGREAVSVEASEQDPRVVGIRVGSKTTRECRVPEQLEFAVIPYIDSPRPLQLRTYVDLVRQSDRSLQIRLDSPDLHLFLEHSYQQIEAELAKGLADIQACVSVGQLRRADWRYAEAER